MIIIDGHQDLIFHVFPLNKTPEFVSESFGQISLEKLKRSNIDVIFSSLFLEPGLSSDWKKTKKLLDYRREF